MQCASETAYLLWQPLIGNKSKEKEDSSKKVIPKRKFFSSFFYQDSAVGHFQEIFDQTTMLAHNDIANYVVVY